MDPNIFFTNFEMLAEAPNGVQKLRELILQLAVMGKLVPQDQEDEPASVLIEKIEAEKKRLIKEGKIRKSKQLPPIVREEIIFKIPHKWEWIRLGQIGDWGAGATPNRKNPDYYGGKIKWFKSGELNEKYIAESEEKITDIALKDCSLRMNKKGDVLIAMYGATIGKVAILNTEATTNQAVCACTCFPGVYNEYLFILLKAYKQYFTNQGAGGAQPNISRIKIINTIAPLPPLAEQKRIVAKVDELMALCDQLEARQQKKRELRSKLNSAALDKMLSAESQDEFEENWRRICENFDLLYDNPENVEQLRKAVLQLAVQGKLVEQDEGDEPASVLIEKIKVERKKLANKGSVKKAKSLQPVDLSEAPYELPKGWEWVRFPEIGEFGRGKSKHRPRNDPILFENGIYPLVQTGDVAKANGIIKTYTNLYNETGLNQSNLWPKGTLCITIAANIADSSILGFDACFPDSVVGFIPSPEIGSTRYFEYFMRTMKENLEDFAPSTAQKNINLGILQEVLIPLPPKKELGLIVQKVNQLMALCDSLESKLKLEQEDSEKLMESITHHLLMKETTQK